MYDLSGLGARIRMLRMEKGYTQDGFARELGVSPQAVSKWETGAGFPDIGTLPMIASALDTSIDALFGETQIPVPDNVLPEEPVPGEVQPTFRAAAEPEQEEEQPGTDEAAQVCGETDEAEEPREGAASSEEARSAEQDTEKNRANPFASVDWDAMVDSIFGQVENALQAAKEYGPVGMEKLKDLGRTVSRSVNEFIGNQDAGAEGRSDREGSLVWNGADIDSLSLNLNSGAEVTVEPGEPGRWDVTAEGSPEFLNSIRCIEDGNTLKVETAPVHQSRRSLLFGGVRNTLTIRTGYALGTELDAAVRGSGSLRCGPDFQSTRVTVYGSGDVELGDVGNFTCQINGSGDLDFRSASNLNLTIRGSGDVSGDAVTGVSEIKVYGSGDAELHEVTGQLSCLSFGSGDIDIGSAELGTFSVTSNGAGDIEVSDGHAGHLELSMHGAGDFDGDGLTVDTLNAVLNGAADAVIGRLTGTSTEHVGHASSLRILQRG